MIFLNTFKHQLMVTGAGGPAGVRVAYPVALDNTAEPGYVMILPLRIVENLVLEMISKTEIVCCGVVDWVSKLP